MNQKKNYFYVSLSSQHVYLCVGVNSCLHSEGFLFFLLLLLVLFVGVLCAHYNTVSVCVRPDLDGERGEEMAERKPHYSE